MIIDTIKKRWPEYIIEILVIVIGILAAFALNTWNANQNEKRVEKEFISNLNEEFAGTYRDMDVVAEAIKAGFAKDKARLDLADHFKPPAITNYQTNQVRLPVLVGEK